MLEKTGQLLRMPCRCFTAWLVLGIAPCGTQENRMVHSGYKQQRLTRYIFLGPSSLRKKCLLPRMHVLNSLKWRWRERICIILHRRSSWCFIFILWCPGHRVLMFKKHFCTMLEGFSLDSGDHYPTRLCYFVYLGELAIILQWCVCVLLLTNAATRTIKNNENNDMRIYPWNIFLFQYISIYIHMHI